MPTHQGVDLIEGKRFLLLCLVEGIAKSLQCLSPFRQPDTVFLFEANDRPILEIDFPFHPRSGLHRQRDGQEEYQPKNAFHRFSPFFTLPEMEVVCFLTDHRSTFSVDRPIRKQMYILFPSFFTTGRNIYVSDYKHLAAEKISCRFACLVKEKMYNFS